MVQTDHTLMALVRREIGSRGFSWKKSDWTLVRLIEDWSWWAKSNVALAGQLLLVVEVIVHQRAGALVIKHVLPWKPC